MVLAAATRSGEPQARNAPQDVFADKSGFHGAQLGAFERGEMNLTIGSLLLLAQTLRVKVGELFRGLED